LQLRKLLLEMRACDAATPALGISVASVMNVVIVSPLLIVIPSVDPRSLSA
jgi:hypothetical protein